MKVKIAQSRLSLSDPMDYTVYGILQARILEWVAFPFSRGLSNPGTKPGSPALQADSVSATRGAQNAERKETINKVKRHLSEWEKNTK